MCESEGSLHQGRLWQRVLVFSKLPGPSAAPSSPAAWHFAPAVFGAARAWRFQRPGNPLEVTLHGKWMAHLVGMRKMVILSGLAARHAIHFHDYVRGATITALFPQRILDIIQDPIGAMKENRSFTIRISISALSCLMSSVCFLLS